MIQIPKGTKDVLPSESYKWQEIETKIREVCKNYCYNEIRTPVFEHTELFTRGIGDTTDIVNKEMYTFLDKGKRFITLRPEGTAGVVRSFIENNLGEANSINKMYYFSSCYRYEKPQAGRLREFHQFGIEVLGSNEPVSDVEVISLGYSVLTALSKANFKLGINSVGCPECRAEYNKILREYFADKDICSLCKERLEKNPMRVLDCKEEKCGKITKDAPKMLDYICEPCITHFEKVKSLLDTTDINYVVDTGIVRGLDYYTGTVFEFSSDSMGSQNVICGGGRYNKLVEEMDGKPTPAVGFGLGMERFLMFLEAEGKEWKESRPAIFIGFFEGYEELAMSLTNRIRKLGKSCQLELLGRSVKAQMKYANKINAKYSIIIGEEEATTGFAKMKNMDTGKEIEFDIKEWDGEHV